MSPAIRRLLAEVAAGRVGPAISARAREILEREDGARRRRAEKSAPRRKAEREGARARFERLAKIREAVFARAGGRCEAYHTRLGPQGPVWVRCSAKAASLDHWLGGVGRRRAREGTESCWALCPIDDRERTINRPSAAFWNASYEQHCKENGLRFVPHLTRPTTTGL